MGHFLFAWMWAFVVVASVAYRFSRDGWPLDQALVAILLPYAIGALAGGWGGSLLAHRALANRPAPARAAGYFFSVVVATLAITMLAFYLPHRAYFAQWHAAPFSVTWMFQIFFTGLGSVYLFISTGLRPYLPFAILYLAAAAVLFARRDNTSVGKSNAR